MEDITLTDHRRSQTVICFHGASSSHSKSNSPQNHHLRRNLSIGTERNHRGAFAPNLEPACHSPRTINKDPKKCPSEFVHGIDPFFLRDFFTKSVCRLLENHNDPHPTVSNVKNSLAYLHAKKSSHFYGTRITD